MGQYEADGESCWFVTHERMLKGMESNEFLDIGDHDTYMYGMTFESVREVMKENKLCVIDCRPDGFAEVSYIIIVPRLVPGTKLAVPVLGMPVPIRFRYFHVSSGSDSGYPPGISGYKFRLKI